jgi:predicted Fe-Mo cluster-binding NifX family protein
MKIAIASDGKGLESVISNQAGRAPYFQIIEGGKVVEVISNPFALGGGGVGIAVARMLSDMGIEKLIAKNAGGNMVDALKEKKIELAEGGGFVKDFLEDLRG